jgi:NADPH:quinone reductase-like Zn-dependent oxidoreductase
MKAAVSTGYGPPDVVRVGDVPEPTPGPGDLLVRVHATTVNRTDCGYRAAQPWFIRAISGWRAPKVPVWGTEFAGTVEDVGPEVAGFAVGERVFGYCEGRFGAHAEYVAVGAESLVARVPDGIDLSTAAPSTEGGHYALSFIRRGQVRPGQNVLVNGGTGGIGSATVQLLADLGVHVTATAPTAHLDLVRQLGAEEVIDFQTTELTALGESFDAVLDAVGKSTFGACRRLLTPRGVYLSSELGPFWQNPPLALATRLSRGRRVIFPIPIETPDVIEHLRSRLESGAYRPVIDRTYPLEDIVEAYRYVQSGQKVGNVVIAVADR